MLLAPTSTAAVAPPRSSAAVDELADERARWRFESDGDQVAVTAGAKAAEAQFGKRLSRVLHGISEIVRERASGSGLEQALLGVSLSTTVDGYAANRLRSLLDSGTVADKPAAIAAAFTGEVERASSGRVAATWHGGWIDMGPILSTLVAAHAGSSEDASEGARLRGTTIAYLLSHEIEHAITPNTSAASKDVEREEARAEAVTLLPGVVAKTAAELGLPTIPLAKDAAFDTAIAATKLAGLVDAGRAAAARKFLAAAQIDIDSPPSSVDDVRRSLDG